jgi:hypothetical protein
VPARKPLSIRPGSAASSKSPRTVNARDPDAVLVDVRLDRQGDTAIPGSPLGPRVLALDLTADARM